MIITIGQVYNSTYLYIWEGSRDVTLAYCLIFIYIFSYTFLFYSALFGFAVISIKYVERTFYVFTCKAVIIFIWYNYLLYYLPIWFCVYTLACFYYYATELAEPS